MKAIPGRNRTACRLPRKVGSRSWESPLDPPGTDKEAIIDVMEWVYLAIFTFELVAKIIAMGFAFHAHSYLRDAWCQVIPTNSSPVINVCLRGELKYKV